MTSKKNISSAFNMSFGFIPLLITLILSQITSQDISIYVGALIGVVASAISIVKKGVKIPKFLLILSTLILLVFTLTSLVTSNYCPHGYLPITIEISVFIAMAIIFLHKKRFIDFLIRRQGACNKQFYIQAAEASVVSSRIFLLVAATHFIIMGIFSILSQNIFTYRSHIFYDIFPPIVFVATIIINQIAIYYFNHLTKHIEYIPIVNSNGTVIGKTLGLDVINYKNTYTNPVIRIIAASKGKIYLCNRSSNCIIEQNKLDLPMECYLKFGETLEEGAQRLLKNSFPKLKGIKPMFNLVYPYKDEHTSRLNYLFLIDVDDENLVQNNSFKNGGFRSFEEIDKIIENNEVSRLLNQEYEHIKNIIYTREKYKGS